MNIFDGIDRFIALPREQAYNLFSDERNLKTLKIIIIVFAVVSFITFAANLATLGYWNFSLMLTIINLFILIFLRIFYNKIFNVSNIRKNLLVFLVAQILIFMAIEITFPETTPDETQVSQNKVQPQPKPDAKSKDTIMKGDDFAVTFSEDDEDFLHYFLITGIFVIIFRFSKTEIVQLFAIGATIPLIGIIVTNAPLEAEEIIPSTLIGAMLFVIGLTREKSRQKKFFEQYDFHFRKNYENLRMKKELDYAREIQLSMLPENDATIGEVDISAVSIPASEVGGDYFDYFKISENEIGLFICDVSGHGVASALMLSGLRSCMHLILEDNSEPKQVLEKLNRMIRKTQNRKMFVTAVFAVINTVTNKCMLFNAGHLPPYKISGESQEIFRIKKHGIALGAMSNVEKMGTDNEVVIDFKKGDKIVFYTDGVNEAMNKDKTEYGLENLELFLNNNSNKNARELLRGLVQDVKKFMSNSFQRDDLTLLIISRN